MLEQQKIPTEEKLNLLLKNNCAEKVEEYIKQFKLPYEVIYEDETGLGRLQITLSQGDQFLNKFITVTPECIKMKEEARKMAKTDYEVLISGETGTGKEIIAMSMIGSREGPVKALNCAGFPKELIESELFGHVKGSFTGANQDKIGLMKSAENGVCFLDEIGELDMPVQSKLLRAIQSKKIRKVGSNNEEDINCKFVFATNRSLRAMIPSMFRLDLFARISTLEIDILPLRKRLEDCQPIIESLPGGKKFLEAYPMSEVRQMDLSLNVRSLQQYVIRYNVLGNI